MNTAAAFYGRDRCYHGYVGGRVWNRGQRDPARYNREVLDEVKQLCFFPFLQEGTVNNVYPVGDSSGVTPRTNWLRSWVAGSQEHH